MKINEIFYSIQGEGIQSGLPTVFIRLTGCNLRCSYCDTKYAYTKGKQFSIDEIILKLKDFTCNTVCITGGEPLIHEDILELVNTLSNDKYNILIETNGSKKIDSLLTVQKLMISLDIKCPSSGMQDQMIMENIEKLRKYDQLKFIIQSKDDYHYGVEILKKYKPMSFVFFQPVWGFDLKQIADWMITDGSKARLGVQLHKFIWGEKTKK